MVDGPVRIMRKKSLVKNGIKYYEHLVSLLYLAVLGLVACEGHATQQGSEITLLGKLGPVRAAPVFFAAQHSGVTSYDHLGLMPVPHLHSWRQSLLLFGQRPAAVAVG